jgi:Sec7-like guanine-nucleotide exchange factor
VIEIIGESKELNKKILNNYLDLFNFKNLDVVTAKRVFITTFLMRGGKKNY